MISNVHVGSSVCVQILKKIIASEPNQQQVAVFGKLCFKMHLAISQMWVNEWNH